MSHCRSHLQVVVRPAVSDLTVSVSGSQLTSGEGVSVDVEMFNTMKQLLVLNLTAVSTHTEFSLEVLSPASRMGSRAIWTFMLDDVIVMNRTTDSWSLNVSLTAAGCYKVTVKAFSPISWASFCTHILAQEPVGELLLNVPSVITTHRKHFVSFSVTAGSNLTVSLLVNATLLYRNSNYTTGEEATVVLLFDHTGTVVVELRAENGVSSQNKSVRACVEGNRKPLPQVRVNPTWQPPTSKSPVHSPADNGEVVFLTNTRWAVQNIWTLIKHFRKGLWLFFL